MSLALPELAVSSIDDTAYEFLRGLVYEHSRIHLGPDKKALVLGYSYRHHRTELFHAWVCLA